jgi:integrase
VARGSIKKHIAKDGAVSYYGRATLIDPATGKRTQPQRHWPSEREAERGMAQWLVEIAQNAHVDRSRMTVGELLDYWLDTYIAGRKAITTVDSYANVVRLHLKPGLGQIAVQKLLARHIQQFYVAKEHAGASAVILKRCHMHLCSALDIAVSPLGLVARNEGRLARLPERRSEHARRAKIALSAAQARTLYAQMPTARYGALYHLLLSTGIRRGEALGLRWRDIDWAAGTITVAQTVAPRGGPGFVIKDTKNRKARTLHVPAPALEALRAHRAAQDEVRLAAGTKWQAEYDLVYCLADGTPMDPDRCQHDFRALRARAGLPPITLHELRHTFITLALENGIPMQVVSKMAGHSRVSTTMDIYSHVAPQLELAAVQVMTEVLFGTA